MIHRIFRAAVDPRQVADVLAGLMGERAYPFPGAVPDSSIAISGDDHGGMIDAYRVNMSLTPGGTPARP